MTTIRGPSPQAEVDPAAGKTVAEILGEIVWLMTQDPSARDMPIREIERLVMPAILLQRFHIAYAPLANGTLLPARVDIWDGNDRRASPVATYVVGTA